MPLKASDFRKKKNVNILLCLWTERYYEKMKKQILRRKEIFDCHDELVFELKSQVLCFLDDLNSGITIGLLSREPGCFIDYLYLMLKKEKGLK